MKDISDDKNSRSASSSNELSACIWRKPGKPEDRNEKGEYTRNEESLRKYLWLKDGIILFEEHQRTQYSWIPENIDKKGSGLRGTSSC